MHSFHCSLEKSLQKFRLEFLFNYPWNFISFFTKGWVRVHQFPRCTYKWHFTGLRGGKCDRVHQSPLDLINCQLYVYYLALKKILLLSVYRHFLVKIIDLRFPSSWQWWNAKIHSYWRSLFKNGKTTICINGKDFLLSKNFNFKNGFGFFLAPKISGYCWETSKSQCLKMTKNGLFFITFVSWA